MTLERNDESSTSLESLMPLVYDELRRLAAHYLRGERRNHTLQPTALVNEAYLCLARQNELLCRDREHFVAIAANTMRRVLVDHARQRGAAKRGGDRRQVTLHSWIRVDERDVDIMALDEALGKLGEFDPNACRIIELRYFGGLTLEETANALHVSVATAKRRWTVAKAWLYRELKDADK